MKLNFAIWSSEMTMKKSGWMNGLVKKCKACRWLCTLSLTPIDEDLDEEVLEVLAAIRTWRHEDIQPDISPI